MAIDTAMLLVPQMVEKSIRLIGGADNARSTIEATGLDYSELRDELGDYFSIMAGSGLEPVMSSADALLEDMRMLFNPEDNA
jgi:hypothetical protein